MPFPKTRDVGTLMDFIKEHHPSWPKKKKVGAALSQARSMGANIAKPNPYQRAVDKAKG